MTSRLTSKSKSPLDTVSARARIASIKRRLRRLQREAAGSRTSNTQNRPAGN